MYTEGADCTYIPAEDAKCEDKARLACQCWPGIRAILSLRRNRCCKNALVRIIVLEKRTCAPSGSSCASVSWCTSSFLQHVFNNDAKGRGEWRAHRLMLCAGLAPTSPQAPSTPPGPPDSPHPAASTCPSLHRTRSHFQLSLRRRYYVFSR